MREVSVKLKFKHTTTSLLQSTRWQNNRYFNRLFYSPFFYLFFYLIFFQFNFTGISVQFFVISFFSFISFFTSLSSFDDRNWVGNIVTGWISWAMIRIRRKIFQRRKRKRRKGKLLRFALKGRKVNEFFLFF